MSAKKLKTFILAVALLGASVIPVIKLVGFAKEKKWFKSDPDPARASSTPAPGAATVPVTPPPPRPAWEDPNHAPQNATEFGAMLQRHRTITLAMRGWVVMRPVTSTHVLTAGDSGIEIPLSPKELVEIEVPLEFSYRGRGRFEMTGTPRDQFVLQEMENGRVTAYEPYTRGPNLQGTIFRVLGRYPGQKLRVTFFPRR